MQRHSGDTFGNRFRGISLFFGLLAIFSLVAAAMRGCSTSQLNKPDEAQLKRVATRQGIEDEQNAIMTQYGLSGASAKTKIGEILPIISDRKEAKTTFVVPGSPTQLKLMKEQQPEAPAPTPEAPAPTPEAPAPTPEAPAPTPEAPAPTPEAPAPTPEAPAPTPEAPAPTPEAPAPTPEAPAPTPEAPAPTPEAPAPTPPQL